MAPQPSFFEPYDQPEEEIAMARIDELTDGIYRIATTVAIPGGDFTFNQFLIDDERPALVHTGMHNLYEGVRNAVLEVLDPAKLAYVILLHFESDECGGMDRFLEGAPDSTLACSALSAELNLSGWDYRGRVEGHRDGEVIDLGERKLRFLETPHVHHWDSMMLFEETTKSLFPSDLFIQPGDQPPVVSEDLGTEMCAFYREVGIFAHEEPVRRVVDRVEALDPDWVHGMHGGRLGRGSFPAYVRSAEGGAVRVPGEAARARDLTSSRAPTGG
jgi:flavorubredoxin